MSFIETDWDKIIKETALKYYQNNNVLVPDIKSIDFLKYNELVHAVSSMVVKKKVVVCTSNCAETVKKMWEAEKTMIKGLKGETVDVQKFSAIRQIIEGLLKASDFRDEDDIQITSIEKTNFLQGKETGFMGIGNAKSLLTGGGLTQRSKQQWRKEVTRRVQQARLEKK